MCSRRCKVVSLYIAILYVRPALTEQSQAISVTSASNAESAGESPVEADLKLSDRAQAAVDKAVDDVVEYSKQAGHTERVVFWNARRGHPITIGDIQALLKDFESITEKYEFRTAERLSLNLQVVADELKEQSWPLFVLIEVHLSFLDNDFERYDSALKRLDIVVETFKEHDAWSSKSQMLLVGKAHYLRKTGRYAEAEQMYLRILKGADEHSENLSKDYMLTAKFELAATYADMGAYQKCQQWMPNGARDYYDENGTTVSDRVAIVYSTNVEYFMLSDKKDLDNAEALCQTLIERMQHYDGVLSPSYVAAIELMAKVRLAQAQYNEAIELLNKSSGIRTELFGNDHPSIANTRAEVARIRKLALERKTTVSK
jgi:tetratricopeptide (TPR) repeat protein